MTATQTQTQSVGRTVVQTLLGGFVVLLTMPLGVGPVAGGWLAGRNTRRVGHGLAASAVAGCLGAVPWGVVVYLAASGAIPPVGYHEGIVHVGVNTAPPELFSVWQEIGLAVLFTGVVVGLSVAGGVLAALSRGTERRRSSDLV